MADLYFYSGVLEKYRYYFITRAVEGRIGSLVMNVYVLPVILGDYRLGVYIAYLRRHYMLLLSIIY